LFVCLFVAVFLLQFCLFVCLFVCLLVCWFVCCFVLFCFVLFCFVLFCLLSALSDYFCFVCGSTAPPRPPLQMPRPLQMHAAVSFACVWCCSVRRPNPATTQYMSHDKKTDRQSEVQSPKSRIRRPQQSDVRCHKQKQRPDTRNTDQRLETVTAIKDQSHTDTRPQHTHNTHAHTHTHTLT